MNAGAIDVEELQYALKVMGIQKSAAEVQELMDSVDKDGSGTGEGGFEFSFPQSGQTLLTGSSQCVLLVLLYGLAMPFRDIQRRHIVSYLLHHKLLTRHINMYMHAWGGGCFTTAMPQNATQT